MAIVASGAVSAFDKDFSGYKGLTFSSLVCLIALWFYAILHFAIDLSEAEKRPVFYGSSLFPIYKYNPVSMDIEQHYGPTLGWAIGCILCMLWAFMSTYGLTPEWFGAVISIGVQLLIILSCIHFVSVTKQSIANIAGMADGKTYRRAWLETKKTYVKQKGAYVRNNLATYRKIWGQRF